MGILRVYLALCVLATHSGMVFPWRMHEGWQAVQIFYIISGFYMALVLSSHYGNVHDFYVSRALRIFPPYYVVLVGTIAASVITGLICHDWLFLTPYLDNPLQRNGATGVILAAISNLTLFGQDWVMFLNHKHGGPLQISPDFWKDPHPLYKYLFVRQCWSVGVELTFYALAPWLCRWRTRWLFLLAAGACAARLFAYGRLGLDYDPWNYRFFPFEISLFVLGMLAYRLYARTAAWHPPARFRCLARSSYYMAAVALLGFLALHVWGVASLGLLVGTNFAVLISYVFWALTIPVLFLIFGNQKNDRIVGELSYPIYLVHYVVVAVVALLIPTGIGVVSAVISLFLSILFYRGFIAPLDKKRHAISKAQITKPPC